MRKSKEQKMVSYQTTMPHCVLIQGVGFFLSSVTHMIEAVGFHDNAALAWLEDSVPFWNAMTSMWCGMTQT